MRAGRSVDGYMGEIGEKEKTKNKNVVSYILIWKVKIIFSLS